MFLLGSLFTPFQNESVEAQNTDVKVFDDKVPRFTGSSGKSVDIKFRRLG